MSEDYEVDYEVNCPYCGHTPLHNRFCANLFCDEGFIDESEDDPINFTPGELVIPCPDCKGTGVEWWCPKCGKNLSDNKRLQQQFNELNELQNPD